MTMAMIINECVSKKWRQNLLQLLCKKKPRVFRLPVYIPGFSHEKNMSVCMICQYILTLFLMTQNQTGRFVKRFLSLFKRCFLF